MDGIDGAGNHELETKKKNRKEELSKSVAIVGQRFQGIPQQANYSVNYRNAVPGGSGERICGFDTDDFTLRTNDFGGGDSSLNPQKCLEMQFFEIFIIVQGVKHFTPNKWLRF